MTQAAIGSKCPSTLPPPALLAVRAVRAVRVVRSSLLIHLISQRHVARAHTSDISMDQQRRPSLTSGERHGGWQTRPSSAQAAVDHTGNMSLCRTSGDDFGLSLHRTSLSSSVRPETDSNSLRWSSPSMFPPIKLPNGPVSCLQSFLSLSLSLV
jgi:hypothetical protein